MVGEDERDAQEARVDGGGDAEEAGRGHVHDLGAEGLEEVEAAHLGVEGQADVLVEREAEARRIAHGEVQELGRRVGHVVRRHDGHRVPRPVQVLEHLLEPVRVPAHVREGLSLGELQCEGIRRGRVQGWTY